MQLHQIGHGCGTVWYAFNRLSHEYGGYSKTAY